MPARSVMIGRVYGSHSAIFCSRVTVAPSSTSRRAPYGTRKRARSRPFGSTSTISQFRLMTTAALELLMTTTRLLIATVPSWLASTLLTSAPRWAAPPMWNVRIVSWVPGSPIDCAAITPTASPMLTGVPRARSRP